MLLLRTLLTAALAGLAASQTMTTPGRVGVQTTFNGMSSGFKLRMVDSTGAASRAFWNINYMGLAESDANGNVIPSRSENLQLVPVDVGANKVHLAQVVSQNGGGNVQVFANHTIYPSTQQIVYNNQTINVTSNELKIALYVQGWQFQTAADRLQFRIKISSNGGNNGPSAANNRTFVMVGDSEAVTASLSFEGTCLIDESSTPMPVVVSKSGNIVTVSFPSFSNQVWYDPTIVASSGASSLAIGATALLAMLLAFFSLSN